MQDMTYHTRLERIIDAALAENAIRQWPQSGELVRTKKKISEVESHFEDFRLAIGRRIQTKDKIIVEWTSDYGDGRLYRNVTIAELEDGLATIVTDYWGAPFEKPDWRSKHTEMMDANPIWPTGSKLRGDKETV